MAVIKTLYFCLYEMKDVLRLKNNYGPTLMLNEKNIILNAGSKNSFLKITLNEELFLERYVYSTYYLTITKIRYGYLIRSFLIHLLTNNKELL